MEFKIAENGNYIIIELLPNTNNKSGYVVDGDWVKVKVSLRDGVFSGEFFAEFMIADFKFLKESIENLYVNLNGECRFAPLEQQLVFDINGDGLGHFEVYGFSRDKIYSDNQLCFSLSFDQTELKRLSTELKNILQKLEV